MTQPLTEEWMAQLGRDDGAELADWVVDALGEIQDPRESQRVAESAVRRIHELLHEYEQRGVSAELVAVWRAACVAEIYRRFAIVREKIGGLPPDTAPGDPKGETSSP